MLRTIRTDFYFGFGQKLVQLMDSFLHRVFHAFRFRDGLFKFVNGSFWHRLDLSTQNSGVEESFSRFRLLAPNPYARIQIPNEKPGPGLNADVVGVRHSKFISMFTTPIKRTAVGNFDNDIRCEFVPLGLA